MRYHDFHLREYQVSDFGRRITLHLVYDYPGKPKEESQIVFSEVALYHFTHTGGAILTDVVEKSLTDLFEEVGGTLMEWNRQLGVAGWRDTLEGFRNTLEAAGHKAWRIDSAIGFSGFVVAKSALQVEPDSSMEWTRDR